MKQLISERPPVADALLQLAFGGQSPRTLDTLLAKHGSPEAVVAAVRSGRIRSTSHAVAAASVGADERRTQLADLGVRWVGDHDAEFPARLMRFEGAPRWLFTIGQFSERPSIGIVGTRTCTAYGVEFAEEYGRTAARAGWSVVSGLAKGIDHAAHVGAVGERGHCHAVLGSGIDVVYPRRHAGLYRSIVETGGVISSEFPPGTRPDGWRFPTRNRIIAGLSDVLLVVEAGQKGGALITARIALDYGVPVFAVPGDVDRPASVGTNLLIRDGAFPIFDGADLAQVLDLLHPLYAVAKAHVE
jgi:DNA processing protein